MGSEFKNREQRNACYKARDAYFECAERLTAEGKDGKVACKQLFDKFEQACGKKWAEHFIRKQDYIKYKEKLQKGGVEAEDRERLNSKS